MNLSPSKNKITFKQIQFLPDINKELIKKQNQNDVQFQEINNMK